MVGHVQGCPHLVRDRASKSCRRADARLRKISQNLRNFLPFERNIGENGPNFVFLAQSDRVFFNLTCFNGIFSACLCAKFYFENSVCAKEFSFRRSVCG